MIVAQIAEDLAVLIAAAKATHAEATDEQNKAENKYDTRALEASYLAQGQSRKVAELENAKQEYESLAVTAFTADAPIEVGALLSLEQGDSATCYLLGPKAGGIEIDCAGTTITVITPSSPLGQQLVGKKRGEVIVLHGKPFRIAQVC